MRYLLLLFGVAQAQIGSAPPAIVEAYNETAGRVSARSSVDDDFLVGYLYDAWNALPQPLDYADGLKAAAQVVMGVSESKETQPACDALFPKGSAHAGMPADACEALPRLERALDLMRQGSTADMSPLSPWSRWHTRRMHAQQPVARGFVALAHAGIVQGGLLAAQGKRDDAFLRWMEVAGFGHAMARGSLVPHMLGAYIQRSAWQAIATEIRKARPSDRTLRRLHRTALNLAAPAWRHDQVMQAEYVSMFADFLGGLKTEKAEYPPAHEFMGVPMDGTTDRLALATALPSMQRHWAQMVRVAGVPWPQRVQHYAFLEKEVGESWHPLARIAAPNFAAFDRRARYQDCRWKLLAVLTADLLGEPTDRVDPLVGEPVRTRKLGRLHHVKSAVIGHRHERLLTETDRDAPLAIAAPLEPPAE